jgi:RNA polymerase sigma-70 factor, ECF subfamily
MTQPNVPPCHDFQATTAEAYAAYRPRLLARARRILRDDGLAEDAVQEAFVRAWRACTSYDPDRGPLLHWLLTITRNAARDIARVRARQPAVTLADTEVVSPESGIADRVTNQTVLREALARLTAEHRVAIVETVIRDRSPQQVAAELGIPPGTVRTRVHYGLRNLRLALEAADAA